jgi:alkaline phosphatase D
MTWHPAVFFRQRLLLSSLAALSQAFPGYAAERSQAYPFTLGVASGSPRADSIILWTRLLADPLSRYHSPHTAESNLGNCRRRTIPPDCCERRNHRIAGTWHTACMEAMGLKPGRWYWYRFMHGDAISPVGRTRTTPEADSMSNCKAALASCQHWEFGEFAAHRHIAAAHPDLVVFNGDYIYEWGPHDLKHPAQARRRDIESFSLSEYRARYAQVQIRSAIAGSPSGGSLACHLG